MTPENRLRLAGLSERAERIGCSLTDAGQIPEGIYVTAGHPLGNYIDICPVLPPEVDENDDDAIDQYVEFALESDNLMLDGLEAVIADLELRDAQGRVVA